MTGILAVWNDRAADVSDQYEYWYMSDHLPDRVGLPGFLSGRRYEAISADRQFFTSYETASVSVLSSDTYRVRLENPTALTQQIMRHWQGMIRAVCQCEDRAGGYRGSYLLSWRFKDRDVAPSAQTLADSLSGIPGLCRIEVWQSVLSEAPKTTESSFRPTQDQTIGGAVIIEASRASDLKIIRSRLATGDLERQLAKAEASPGEYRLLCTLDNAEAASDPMPAAATFKAESQTSAKQG